MTQYRVHGDGSVNVRVSPDVTAARLGYVNNGDIVDAIEIANGWAKIAIEVKDAPLQNVDGTGKVYGYMYAALLDSLTPLPPPVAPPPVPASSEIAIGVDVIESGADAEKVIAAGAKYLAIAGNGQLAKEIHERHPELLVTHRGMFYKGHLPSWAEFQQFHGYALTKGMIVYGTNENDQIGDGPVEIQKRADWDWEMYRRCQDIGVGFIGAGFSMGVPDVTKSSIRDALRTYYAPKIAAGMNRFNQHLYSGRTNETNPPDIKLRIYRDALTPMTIDGITANNFRATWWLEERVRWYTAWCGFPEATEYWCDEFGMDETPGGFKVHNMSAADVVAYVRQFRKLHSQPTIVNGVQKKHNMKAAAMFQRGSSNWASYEITDEYLAALQQANWAR